MRYPTRTSSWPCWGAIRYGRDQLDDPGSEVTVRTRDPHQSLAAVICSSIVEHEQGEGAAKPWKAGI